MITDGLFTYHPSSFTIHFFNGAEEINWNDIESIFVYKLDWITFDDVYIDLIVNGEIISVCEDINGFHCPPGVFSPSPVRSRDPGNY